jgi:hypothetical protein
METQMKLVSAFVLAAFSVSPVAAQSWSPDGDLTLKKRSTTAPELRVRNAPCTLWIKDYGTHRGRCNIARVKGSRASVFTIGQLKLRVVRDADDSSEAKLYYEHDDEWVLAGAAIAQGNCWTGSRVRFCAQ